MTIEDRRIADDAIAQMMYEVPCCWRCGGDAVGTATFEDGKVHHTCGAAGHGEG